MPQRALCMAQAARAAGMAPATGAQLGWGAAVWGRVGLSGLCGCLLAQNILRFYEIGP